MAACVHGEVCRAWMERTKQKAPLSNTCPFNCPLYERKPSISEYCPNRHAYPKDIFGTPIFYCQKSNL